MGQNETDFLLISVTNGVQKITLNRPRKKNAITPSMYARITDILNTSAQDDKIQMTVITGTGDVFTSGNDISFSAANTDFVSTIKDGVMIFKKFVDALILYPKLLVCVVNGPAIGIGATMLGLYDMVYASDKAYFQTPFSMLGLVAEACSTFTFPRILGSSKAGDMLYFGYKMSAIEAKQLGFINEVYKHENIHEIWSYLNKVSTLSIESILATKRLVKKWNKDILLQVNKEETVELAKRWESPDLFERVAAFLSRKNKL